MPDDTGEPVVTTVCFLPLHTGCGCIGHPAFPAPSIFQGERFLHNPGASRRGSRRDVFQPVIASEAKIPWGWIAAKSEARLRLLKTTHPGDHRCCTIILPLDRPLSARSLAQFSFRWN